MKPIKLELMGLNSYTDKQTIDFEKLTSRGLFGILVIQEVENLPY